MLLCSEDGTLEMSLEGKIANLVLHIMFKMLGWKHRPVLRINSLSRCLETEV